MTYTSEIWGNSHLKMLPKDKRGKSCINFIGVSITEMAVYPSFMKGQKYTLIQSFNDYKHGCKIEILFFCFFGEVGNSCLYLS